MRTRILGWTGGLLVVVLALAATAGMTGATALACDVTAFSGQVTKAGSPVTVRGTDGKDRAIAAGTGLVVVRNGANAAFGDLREGDQVNVTVPAGAADCAATRIEAASTITAPAKDRTGLWGLLGLAGLLPLLRRQPRPVNTVQRVVEYPQPEPVEPVATVRPTERVDQVEHVERLDPDETRDRGATRR